MDMTHAYFQASIHPGDNLKNTLRSADSHTLYELLRSLQGGKNPSIHMQVGAAKDFKDILKNIVI